MTATILILILLPTCLFGYEIWLVLRDAIHGKGSTTNDKGTRYLNFLSIGVGIGLAALLNGQQRFFFPGGRTPVGFIIGVVIMAAGFALRIWAVTTLGTAFRTTIETNTGQKVVDRGPYKLIRHPAYSALLLFCLGYGLALQNWVSLACAFLLPLAALLYRIQLEEPELAASLGREYVDYQKRTKRLIPWVW